MTSESKIMKKLSIFAIIALLGLSFMACSENESSGGAPVITGVRSTSNADSLFTTATAGSIIVILGENLSNALTVTVNDQELFINPTLNTSKSIIVTIPSQENGFVLSSTDTSLTSEIRVETAKGVATYSFIVNAGSPTLTRLDADYPRAAGNTMLLNGSNLLDITDIFITDITPSELKTMTYDEVPGNRVSVTEYSYKEKNHYLNANNYYVTACVVSATIPEGAPEEGTLVVETAGGRATIGFSYLPGEPTITYCSNDMPMIGESLVIIGTDFVNPSLTYGDVTLTEDDFYLSSTNDSIIVDFAQKPTEGSGTVLKVTTAGGSAEVENFYDYSTLLADFVTLSEDVTGTICINLGWSPSATYCASGTDDGDYALLSYDDAGSNWWGTMVYIAHDWEYTSWDLAANTSIPSDATTDNIYLAFACYDDNSSFNDGAFSGIVKYFFETQGKIADASRYEYDGGQSWIDYDASLAQWDINPLSDINGNNPKGRWYRVVVPINKFHFSGNEDNCIFGDMTWADVCNIGISGFRLQGYNSGTSKGTVNVKFDNVRIIYLP